MSPRIKQLNKIKNKSVLDIGSNHGFFSFQSIIHGAKNVVVMASTQLKIGENLLKREKVCA